MRKFDALLDPGGGSGADDCHPVSEPTRQRDRRSCGAGCRYCRPSSRDSSDPTMNTRRISGQVDVKSAGGLFHDPIFRIQFCPSRPK